MFIFFFVFGGNRLNDAIYEQNKNNDIKKITIKRMTSVDRM